MLAVCWPYVGRMLAVCWTYVGREAAVYWPYIGRMLAVYWPYVSRISAIPYLHISLAYLCASRVIIMKFYNYNQFAAPYFIFDHVTNEVQPTCTEFVLLDNTTQCSMLRMPCSDVHC